jgi:hypothetical protein
VKQVLSFAAVSLVLILGGAWGITVLRPDPEIARAVWASAVIALVVQGVAFAVARQFVATNAIVGWGIGSLIRFGMVLVHALVGVRALGLESGPALLSLVGFLFVTMVIEPLFLTPEKQKNA